MRTFSSILCLIQLSLFLWVAGCTPVNEEAEAVKLDVPDNVRLIEAAPNSLAFVWAEVAGAEQYGTRLETSSGSLVGSVTYTKVPQQKYNGLKPSSQYRFMVRAISSETQSDYSEPLSASTESEPSDEDDSSDPGDDDSDPVNPPTANPSEFYAQMQIPASEDSHAKALAFPGAEGGGMYTTGGRGGKVIHVTNLNDSGAGSLRAAVEQKGARIVVFDVAGVIELKKELKISNGDITIAGQTAPGDGICLKNYYFYVGADNVIIRFVRFRLGDASASDSADAIWGRYNKNIILDHCSMSWCVDECASFYANQNFTMQWCLLSESLRNSVHSKEAHGYGGIWGGKDASFHHNMLAHHDSRNPRFDHPQVYGDYLATHRGVVDYRCNVVYNWGDNSSYGGEDGQINMVNNYYKPGPASKDRKYFLAADAKYEKSGTIYADKYPELHITGNVHTKYSNITENNAAGVNWTDGANYANYQKTLASAHKLKGPSGQSVYTTTHSAELAFERVLRYAGASKSRDAVDKRAADDAKSGTASIKDGGNGSTNGLIDKVEAVGGWPEYKASEEELARIKDSDGDGMPDWFEDQFKLDKSQASDGNTKTIDAYARYTNLEMYLHYIVRDIVNAGVEGGEYRTL